MLEATGAYGPIASAILKKIEPADKHQRPNPELMKARNHFLREVSVIMATSSAHMICFARTQMRQEEMAQEEWKSCHRRIEMT